MGFGDFAVMFTALQIVLADVHFGDDALQSYELISHSAVKSTRGHEVGSQIAFNFNIEPINFERLFLFEIITFFLPFKKLFDQHIVFRGILNNLLGSLWEL